MTTTDGQRSNLRHVVVVADFAQAKGGAEQVAVDSARALAEAGLEVTFIFAAGKVADRRLDRPRIRKVGLGLCDVWEMPGLAAAQAGIWHREAARRLEAALAGLPVAGTVVHLHTWTRALSPGVLPALIGGPRPLAVTMHNYFAACPTGMLYRFDTRAPCALKPGSAACITARCDPRSSLHKAVRVARTWATGRAMAPGGFDTIHVSHLAKAALAPHLPAGIRHHVIDNPVRAAPCRPAAIGRDAALAFVGRITHEKGVEVAAEAARRAGLPILFIGAGPGEAAVRRINPDARLLGWRSCEEVAEILRREARAVIAPSLWPDNNPLVVYEGLAAGLPVIVSDRAGAAEKVVDGETGLVVAPTVEALTAAMTRLADIATARRMGAAAHARYWARPMTAARHASELVEVYGAMLERTAAAPASIAAGGGLRPAA